MPSNEIAYLTDENYTNVLKEVHENLDDYIGQQICYTGYVYRVPEIEDNQFILARDMMLENSNQTVVVGFLCSLQNAQEFENYSWIKITGTIEKGYYFGDIPCINISEIEKVSQPENCIVESPNENFIETSVIY
jgi:putative membrane protein